jgi:hypothetical protein
LLQELVWEVVKVLACGRLHDKRGGGGGGGSGRVGAAARWRTEVSKIVQSLVHAIISLLDPQEIIDRIHEHLPNKYIPLPAQHPI